MATLSQPLKRSFRQRGHCISQLSFDFDLVSFESASAMALAEAGHAVVLPELAKAMMEVQLAEQGPAAFGGSLDGEFSFGGSQPELAADTEGSADDFEPDDLGDAGLIDANAEEIPPEVFEGLSCEVSDGKPVATRKDLENALVKYRSYLRGIAYKFISNGEDAEDIVMDATLRAWRAFDTYRGGANLKTWLCTITANTARNAYRNRERQQKYIGLLPGSSEADEDDDYLDNHMSDEGTGNPEGMVEMTQYREQLEQALKALEAARPEAYDVYMLCVLHGYPLAEAARELGLPEKRVGAHRTYANTFLKKAMLAAASQLSDEERSSYVKNRSAQEILLPEGDRRQAWEAAVTHLKAVCKPAWRAVIKARAHNLTPLDLADELDVTPQAAKELLERGYRIIDSHMSNC